MKHKGNVVFVGPFVVCFCVFYVSPVFPLRVLVIKISHIRQGVLMESAHAVDIHSSGGV